MFFRVLLTACTFLIAVSAQAQTVGQKAKLNHVELFDGTRFDPISVEGKPTLIYFWASWCPLCRQELRGLEKRYQANKDKGFTIVAINFRDKTENAKALLETIRPISFLVGSINDNWMSDYPKLRGTPTWMLLDKKGMIRKVVVGELSIEGWHDALEGELKKVIAEEG